MVPVGEIDKRIFIVFEHQLLREHSVEIRYVLTRVSAKPVLYRAIRFDHIDVSATALTNAISKPVAAIDHEAAFFRKLRALDRREVLN